MVGSNNAHRLLSSLKTGSSLLACVSLLLVGCAGQEDYQTVTSEDADRAEAHADHDHDHHHEAPHGGHLIELGKHQYNAEVVLEGEPKQFVIYLLDAHADNAVAIESQSLVFTPEDGEPISLEPQPQDGDAEGTSSRFVASGPTVEGITDLEEVHGNLTVTIKQTEFSGALSHDHDHGEHDHASHDHDDADHEHAKETAAPNN